MGVIFAAVHGRSSSHVLAGWADQGVEVRFWEIGDESKRGEQPLSNMHIDRAFLFS
jgi:hypothetical protein